MTSPLWHEQHKSPSNRTQASPASSLQVRYPRLRPNLRRGTARRLDVWTPVDDPDLAARHEDAAGLFEQSDRALDVRDVEEHGVIDARVGAARAVLGQNAIVRSMGT